jgi:hypothetical protein
MDSDEETLWHVQRDLEALSWLDEDELFEDGLFEDEPDNADAGEEFPCFSDEEVASSDCSRFVMCRLK